MQTIGEHLKTLGYPVGDLAISNTPIAKLAYMVDTVYDALLFGFSWRESAGGFLYWQLIAEQSKEPPTFRCLHPEHELFIAACRSERDHFCASIAAQGWNIKLRTSAESVLIMYDQLIERYRNDRQLQLFQEFAMDLKLPYASEQMLLERINRLNKQP